ncbi:hypothetical protein [Uliginosibacterium gangwonense]|uniref:hypothetical protein n=1 Tax=Uliginosibacterium gangwonense TaxID=392736 RepID=UPI0003738A56|nr:hypothetical protein [Uliginosibacterium gangwonense]
MINWLYTTLNARRIGLCLGMLLWAVGAFQSAWALPSYARQTGDECAACHVGAYGPQLTPHGMRFKLTGYADSNDQGIKIPLSGMVVASFERTAKALSAKPTAHTDTNNNTGMDEASLFLAGRIAPHVGSFIQATYSGTEHRASIDNSDIRAANTFKLGDLDAIVGISLNNNPGVQDPFNTLPVWGFPYASTELVPGYASPMLSGGLGQHVTGLTAYTMLNDSLYAEFGGYRSLSHGASIRLGVDDTGSSRVASNTYWRLAWMRNQRAYNWSVGLVGMNTGLKPDLTVSDIDRYKDIGIDANFQYLGNRQHIVTASTSYIRERQNLGATYAAGNSENDHNNLSRWQTTASYFYDQTWGFSSSLFRVRGSSDALLYTPADDSGSRIGSPNTNGYILQADWTPWGKENASSTPWPNLRIGLQYTGYTKFNGASTDYDGSGRKARDNNTTFLFIHTSF